MGGLDELLISTGVDSLIKLVYKRKRISLEDAAMEMDLPFQTVEEWAHILEDSGIISIEYQFTKIFLVWKKGAAEALIKEIGDIEREKADVQRMLREMTARIKARGSELELIESEYKKLISLFDPRIAELSKRVRKIDEIKAKVDEWYTAESEKIDNIKKTLNQLRVGLDETQEKWNQLLKEIEEPKFKLASLKALKRFEESLSKKTDILRRRLEFIEAEINKQRLLYQKVQNVVAKIGMFKKEIEDVRNIKKQVNVAVAAIEKKQKKIDNCLKKFGKGTTPDKAITKLLKRLNNISGTIPEMRKQLDAIDKEISRQTNLLGDLAIAYDELSSRKGKQLYATLLKKTTELDEKIGALKQFQSEIKKTQGIGKEINQLMQKITDFEKDVSAEKKRLIEISQASLADASKQLAVLKKYEKTYDKMKETMIFYANRNKDIKEELDSIISVVEQRKKGLFADVAAEKANIDKDAAKLYLAIQKYKSVLSRRSEIKDILDLIKESKRFRDKILEDLKLISKKLELIKIVKGKEEQAAEQLEAIREELGQTGKDEKELEARRKELRELVEKMWKEEKE